MPIDFTQLHSPASAKTAAASPNLASLLSSLSLRVGEQRPATVTEVRPLTSSEYKLLQPQAQPAPDKGRPSPANANALEQLVNKPGLRLVKVAIEAKQIALLSALALNKGDKVLVERAAPQKLTIVEDGGKAKTPPASNAPASPISSGPLHTKPTLDVTALNTALRQIVPRLNSSGVEQHTSQLNQLIKLLPPSSVKTLITNSLNLLQQQTVNLDRISQLAPQPLAQATAQAVSNSGTFLESKLAAAITHPSPTPQVDIGKIATSDRKAILLNLANLVATAISGNAPAASNLNTLINATSAALSSPDIDALSKAVQQIINRGEPTSPSLANVSSTTASVSSSASSSAAQSYQLQASSHTQEPAKPTAPDLRSKLAMTLTPTLTQALLAGTSARAGSSEANVLQTQLLLLTHQLTLNSLAKVRQQQLGGETTASSRTSEAGTSNVHFSVDLPVRFNENTEHARITFEEEATTGETEGTNKARCWLVKLHVNTEAIGDLYIHLRYLNEQLGIGFWAQTDSVLTEAKHKLDSMRSAMVAAGIEITKVDYHKGQPSGAANELSYNLVDITT